MALPTPLWMGKTRNNMERLCTLLCIKNTSILKLRIWPDHCRNYTTQKSVYRNRLCRPQCRVGTSGPQLACTLTPLPYEDPSLHQADFHSSCSPQLKLTSWKGPSQTPSFAQTVPFSLIVHHVPFLQRTYHNLCIDLTCVLICWVFVFTLGPQILWKQATESPLLHGINTVPNKVAYNGHSNIWAKGDKYTIINSASQIPRSRKRSWCSG